MRLLPLALIAAAILSGCAIIVAPNDGDVALHTVFDSKAVTGDGRVSSERRSVAGLAELDMSGPLNVEVRVGEAPSLQIEADSNLLPLVRTEQAGGALRVWVQGSVRTNNALRVIYTVPRLSQVRASGSGRLGITGLQGGALTLAKSGSGDSQLSGRVSSLTVDARGSGSVIASALESGDANVSLSGSGRVQLGQVRADRLNLTLRGSGDVMVGGRVTNLSARVTGSGGANLMELHSERADLETTGSGEINARVKESLVAQVTGSGRITVHGNPVQRNVSGKGVRVVN
jgi:hypothetical protein